MIHNSTIDTQLNHKSIRKFKDITLNHEQLETLYTVFSRTATSMFMQNASLLHMKPKNKRSRNFAVKNMLVLKETYLFLLSIFTAISKLESN